MAMVIDGQDKEVHDTPSQTTIWRRNNPERFRAYRQKYEKNNREHHNAWKRLWRKSHPENMREQWLQQHYGIGTTWYKIKLAMQNFCCAICKRPASMFQKSLHVDHDHTTHKNRGLLCTGCNTLLGTIEKNRVSIGQIVAYLKEYDSLVYD